MLFDKALIVMENGGHVESLISCTAYHISLEKNTLYAEGLPVHKDYLTKEEILGEWREIYVIETKEDMDKLSEKERDALIEETFKGFSQKRNFDKKHKKENFVGDYEVNPDIFKPEILELIRFSIEDED